MADALIGKVKALEEDVRKLKTLIVRQSSAVIIGGNRVSTAVDYTALANDSWIIATAACTVFLYATPLDNQQIDVTTDANITIDGNGININGAASIAAFVGESYTLRYDPDSGQWRVI